MHKFFHILQRSGLALGAGTIMAIGITGFSFAQQPSAISKVHSQALIVTPKTQTSDLSIKTDGHLIGQQRGTMSMTSLPDGDWVATWHWSKLTQGQFVTLYGWNHVQGPYIASNYQQYLIKAQAGEAQVTFSPPKGWTGHHEVMQFTTDFLSRYSPVGQLPEVPWAAALPLLAISPIILRKLKQSIRAK